MSFGKSKSDSGSTFDPTLKKAFMDTYEYGKEVADTPYQPYPAATVAPFSPFELEGMTGGVKAAREGVGQAEIAQGIGSAGGVAGFQPGTVTAGGITAQQFAPSAIAPPLLRDTSIDPYMSPYTQQVVDTSLQDVERTRQLQQQRNAAAAQAAGAFGGARHGLVESETNRAALRASGDIGAKLRAQGFESAAGRAAQDVGLRADIDRFNVQQGMSAAEANQRAALEAARASQDAGLRAALANQETGLRGADVRLRGAETLANLGGALRGARFADAAALTDVGARQRGMGQSLLEDRFRRFGERVEWPYRGVDVMRGVTGILPNPLTQRSKGRTLNLGLY
jgi:hypothetical protein